MTQAATSLTRTAADELQAIQPPLPQEPCTPSAQPPWGSSLPDVTVDLRLQWQPDRELASVPEAGACRTDVATVPLDQTAYHGKSDPEARFPAVRRRIRLNEQIEHMRQDIREDPDTGVANAHDGRALLLFHR